MGNFRNVRWQHWLLIVGFALSLAITGFFAIQAIREAPHRRREESIRSWMNIPYIAYSYHVPAHILYQALGLASIPRDRRPLLEIARQEHQPVENLILNLEAAITQYRLTTTPAPTETPSPPGSTS
jgi:hypothetical protein